MCRSFTEYSKNYLYDAILERVRDYVESSGGELQSMEISRANAYNLPKLKVGFDIAVNYEYTTYDKYEDDVYTKNNRFLVQGSLDLGNGDKKPVISSVENYCCMPKRKFMFSDSLVPMFDDCECMDVANNLLKEFYPEHLRQPGMLNVDLLIKRMGLKLVHISIREKGVKAKIMLRDGYFEGNYYSSGTILANKDTVYEYGMASYRFNIVHECVHWYCHRKWALWESFSEDKDFASEWDFVNFGGFDGSFIETQTNKIAGMVLAPDQTLKDFVNLFLTGCFKPARQEDYLRVLPDVVEVVGLKYCISKAVVKIRMKQCGWVLIDGIGNYVDGHRVRDYVFNPGALPDNDIIYTFTISHEDVLRIGETNPKIKDYLELGALLYVENHIVVNSPKFIQDTEDGYILTDYALTHMDECAIRFYTRVEVLPNSAGGGSLSRKNGGNSVAYCQVDEGLLMADMLKKSILNDTLKELSEMNFDYRNNLRVILNRRNITQEQLAEILDCSLSTVKRFFSDDYEPKKWDVYHICLALKLPKKVSDKLLESGGIKLNTETYEGGFMDNLLNYGIGLSYSTKLKMLYQENILKKSVKF